MSHNQMHKHRDLYEKTAIPRKLETRGLIDLVEMYDNQTANFRSYFPLWSIVRVHYKDKSDKAV